MTKSSRILRPITGYDLYLAHYFQLELVIPMIRFETYWNNGEFDLILEFEVPYSEETLFAIFNMPNSRNIRLS